MFFVHTFHRNGQRKLGSFSTLVISDLKRLASIRRRVHASGCLDTKCGYEVEEVPTSNPRAPGKVIYRSRRARQLFGEVR